VLDDPVSSLDHRYRKRVAERLTREAKSRQIVVFTHDVVFLYLIRKYASKLAVPVHERTLLRGYRGNHGVAEEGPPWVAMKVNQRIGRLRAELQEAWAELNKGRQQSYEQKASWIYLRLRESWERAIEEVLLNRVVMRFADSVETQRLKPIHDISEADIEYVDMEMTRCSGYVHDEAGAAYEGIPGPDTVAEDIKKLADWVDDLRSNRGQG
jgi:ABC-type multidrug transport system ATPase subunit